MGVWVLFYGRARGLHDSGEWGGMVGLPSLRPCSGVGGCVAVVAQSKELCGFVGKVVDGKVPDSWGAS